MFTRVQQIWPCVLVFSSAVQPALETFVRWCSVPPNMEVALLPLTATVDEYPGYAASFTYVLLVVFAGGL